MRSILACLVCVCVLSMNLPIGAQKSNRTFLVPSAAPEFTAGNIVVCRVGTGSAALGTSATEVFLDEYTTDGAFVSSIAMPTTNGETQKAFTVAGSTQYECQLNRSTDGRYLVLVGYPQTPGTETVTSTISPRVFARVDSAGNVDTSTTTSSFSNGAVRAATSVDGTGFWGVGAGPGVVYKQFGTTGSGTTVNSPFSGLRGINIFDGQLYTSGVNGSFRLGTVGTGIPITSGNATVTLPGLPTIASPYAFFFADLDPAVAGVDTLYVADDGTAGSALANGGIKKFALVSGSWVFKGNFPGSTGPPAITASFFIGVTGVVNGTQVILYATQKTADGQLVRYVDATGYNVAPTAVPTLLATAGTNKAFRGVALAPVQPAALPNLSIDDVSVAEGHAGTTTHTFTVTLSSPAPAGGVTFDIATADGAAQDANPGSEDADYTVNSLTGQTIAAGATTHQFTVMVNGDGIYEPDETYFVNVTNVVGATVADGQGQGTIVNDDLAPTAGPVSVNGRVLTQQGRGIGNAAVTLTDRYGATFHARTNSFGYYRFENVPAGESYVLTVRAKMYSFTPQLLAAEADISGLNIYPEQ